MVLQYLPPNIAAYLENPWLYALAVVVAFYIGAQILLFICQRIFLRITKKTKTDIDDKIVDGTNRPFSFLLFMFGVRIALVTLEAYPRVMPIIKNITDTIIIATITYIVIVIVDIIIASAGKAWASKTKSELDDALIPLFHKISRVSLGVIGMIIILDQWGIEIGPFLASLGIAGIAIGFAVQDSLKNIFGGISLILDKAYKVGDRLQLADGTVGTVHDIGIRSTRIRTFDNELILVPNGQMANMTIHNQTNPDPKVRGIVSYGVEYGSNPEKVKKLALEILKKHPKILKEPEPFTKFDSMADSALIFKSFFWVKNPDDRFPVMEDVLTETYTMLNKHKIGIPFPTRTVYVHQAKRRKK